MALSWIVIMRGVEYIVWNAIPNRLSYCGLDCSCSFCGNNPLFFSLLQLFLFFLCVILSLFLSFSLSSALSAALMANRYLLSEQETIYTQLD